MIKDGFFAQNGPNLWIKNAGHWVPGNNIITQKATNF